MREMKRAIHIDFHNMPGIEDLGAHIDTADFAETLAEAQVDYVNIFARCNIGFSYYPTKLGTQYPGMKGNLLGDMIKECHKRGIGVSAYLNGGLNRELAMKRLEFAEVKKEEWQEYGGIGPKKIFRAPCINTGYRAYLLAEIQEILEMEPDGIFVDCMSPRRCYCAACLKKMQEKNIDIQDDQQVFAFYVDSLREAFHQIHEIIPEGKRLYINSYPYEDIHMYQSHAEVECLPTSVWGYDYLAATAPYFRKFTDRLVYMTGRFVNGWGDFGGNKPLASLENDVYDALLYGYVPSVGDHMHPRDGLDKKLYSNIGRVYRCVKELEPWTTGTKAVTEVAILRNRVTYGNLSGRVTDSDKGAARMLSELKICYDIVDENMDLDSYRLLILPDNIEITDKLQEKLEGFQGSILSTGKSIRKGSVWDYVKSFEEDNNSDGFYTYEGEVYAQYCNGVKLKSDYRIADYIEPYFQRNYDGNFAHSYVPPKACAGFCSIAGKENRVHIGFAVFEAYLKYGATFHKELVATLLQRMLPEPLLQGEGLPSYTRASLMKGKQTVLHVKTSFPEHRGGRGIIEEHMVLPAGRKICVRGAFQQVYSLPEMKPIKTEVKAGYTRLCLPEITGYKAFLLEK